MSLASVLVLLALIAPPSFTPQNGTPSSATPATQPTSQTAKPATKRQPPKPAATAAQGGAPDKVWVNTGTSVYHCPGDRYYGKTKDGRYMTEKDAKAAGAKGPKGKTCFK